MSHFCLNEVVCYFIHFFRQTFSEYVEWMEAEVKKLMDEHTLPLKLHHSNNNKGNAKNVTFRNERVDNTPN